MVHPIAEANDKSPFGLLTPVEFYTRHSVSHSFDYITNSRGMKLFTQSWTPLPLTKIFGIVAVVHGYTGNSSWFVEQTTVLFAKSEFTTCAIVQQGHGFSEGLTFHIPNINPVVDDCVSFFDLFRARHALSLPSFLYSESLSEAISLLITLRSGCLRRPYDGVVLNDVMYGVSAKFKPPWQLEHFLPIVAVLVLMWQVVPTRGKLLELSFKVDWKHKLAFSCSQWKKARPHAATARELMRLYRELQSRFEEVDLLFLIIHGGEDVVCDPARLEELYQHPSSKDKTIQIYLEMWHQLVGEPDENVELVFVEVVEWLRTRAERAVSSGGGEVEFARGYGDA